MVGFTCSCCGRFVLIKDDSRSQVLCDACLDCDQQTDTDSPNDEGEGY